MTDDRVQSLASEIVAELRALADPKRAEGETRYFKDTINCLGTGMPGLQSVERRLCKGLEKAWDVEDAMRLCDLLLEHRIFEVTLLACEFINRFAKRLGEAELARIEGWLEADLCDNWAAVDSLCNHAVGTMMLNHPDLARRVRAWADSGNRWARRASAVTFILPLRKGGFLDIAYEIATVLIRDKQNDLVQKGNGWMLREAGGVDQGRLECFLLEHGPDIPRTTLRYAIEKFSPEKRAQVLAMTRRA